MAKSPIKIKPENKGLLHKAMGIKQDKKIPAKALNKEAKTAEKTGNTKLKKEVVFAKNAKKWNKK